MCVSVTETETETQPEGSKRQEAFEPFMLSLTLWGQNRYWRILS